MRLSTPAFLDSLFARMVLILLLGLLAAQLSSFWLQCRVRAYLVSQTHHQHFVDRVAEVIRTLESEDQAGRSAQSPALQFGGLKVEPIAESQVSDRKARSQIQMAVNCVYQAGKAGTGRVGSRSMKPICTEV